MDDEVPSNPHDAAEWIARRRSWVRELFARIVVGGTDNADWLHHLTATLVGVEAYRVRWTDRVEAKPEPLNPARWETWADNGPRPTPDVSAFDVMSSGEQRVLRLVAALGGVPWSVPDVSSTYAETWSCGTDWPYSGVGEARTRFSAVTDDLGAARDPGPCAGRCAWSSHPRRRQLV